MNSPLSESSISVDIDYLLSKSIVLCKICGSEDSKLFTQRDKNLCKECKKSVSSNPKTYNCKTCGETESDKFPKGRYSSCKKCRNAKSSEYASKKKIETSKIPKLELKSNILNLDFKTLSRQVPESNEILKDLESRIISLESLDLKFSSRLNSYFYNDKSLLKVCPLSKRIEDLTVSNLSLVETVEKNSKLIKMLLEENESLSSRLEDISKNLDIKIPNLKGKKEKDLKPEEIKSSENKIHLLIN